MPVDVWEVVTVVVLLDVCDDVIEVDGDVVCVVVRVVVGDVVSVVVPVDV